MKDAICTFTAWQMHPKLRVFMSDCAYLCQNIWKLVHLLQESFIILICLVFHFSHFICLMATSTMQIGLPFTYSIKIWTYKCVFSFSFVCILFKMAIIMLIWFNWFPIKKLIEHLSTIVHIVWPQIYNGYYYYLFDI